MKKICLLFFCIVISILFFGCEKDSKNASGSSSVYDTNQTEINKQESSQVVVDESLENKLPCPAEDFDYIISENKVEIQGYIGSERVVVVPQTIEEMSVAAIHNYAFGNDCGIERIRIPESVTMFKETIFVNNKALKEVIIDAHLDVLPESTFLNCSSLESVQLNDGLKTIGDICFSNCVKLNKLYIPETVSNISKTAFLNVSKDFVIEGKAGSYAEDYAREENIPFEAK